MFPVECRLPGISNTQSALLREKVAKVDVRRVLGLVGKGLGGLLGLGAAQSVAGNAYNALNNPTRWYSNDDAFKYHNEQFADKAAPVVSDLNAAIASEDWDRMDSLQQKLSKGNFGGSGWLRRVLMPWGASTDASYNQAAALKSQSAVQAEYDKAMQQHQAFPAKFQRGMGVLEQQLQNPNMLPVRRTALEQQLNQMRARLQRGLPTSSADADAIKDRMTSSGMNFRPYVNPATQQQTTPGVLGSGRPGGYHVPAGPITPPNPRTSGLNSGISPISLNNNDWSLDNSVKRWALNGNGQVARPNV